MDNLPEEYIKIPLETSSGENTTIVEINDGIEEFLEKLGKADDNFIKENFQLNGHMKINNYFLDPINLIHLRKCLLMKGMKEMYFHSSGLVFLYKDFSLSLLGKMEATKERLYFSIELDSQPNIIEKQFIVFYKIIIEELKKLDCVYFLSRINLIEAAENRIGKRYLFK
ncbi:hypothetical protein CDIK_0078 [Cucumispora dikerogammari]|nr:hypothetical protein CDIK_0078 [Cucumispora dikerogammari]